MRGDVIEIRARGTILLIGGAGALAGLPATLRQRSAGVSAVQHLAGDTQALQGLRHFWLRRSHPRSIAVASDRDLLGLVAAGVAHGDLDALVLPSHHARGQAVALSSGARAAARRATRAAAAPPTPRIVARMSPEERLAEVLRRAAARLPRAMGDELLALVTPESIAAALGLAVFGAAANLTPFGWAADVILAAIAFGFGGLAAVHALGDLVTCFERMADAESERDLDAAAEALTRAASAITIAGLAAILHEKARRWGGGGEGQAEQTSADRRRSRAARPQAEGRSGIGTGDKAGSTAAAPTAAAPPKKPPSDRGASGAAGQLTEMRGGTRTGDKAGSAASAPAAAASPDKPPSDYGVAFFGEDNLKYYERDQATLGAPGRSFFLMPSEDSAAVTNAATAAKETGMSPSTSKAYKDGTEIYGITFPTDGMQFSRPTTADAGGHEHFLEGGYTAVKTGDGPNAHFVVNTTREFVTPGGGAVPPGSVLFKLGPSGEWIQMRRF